MAILVFTVMKRMAAHVDIRVVYDDFGRAMIVALRPPSRIVPGFQVEHYRVSGPQAVMEASDKEKVDDFMAWRQAKETEGFVFTPLGK